MARWIVALRITGRWFMPLTFPDWRIHCFLLQLQVWLCDKSDDDMSSPVIICRREEKSCEHWTLFTKLLSSVLAFLFIFWIKSRAIVCNWAKWARWAKILKITKPDIQLCSLKYLHAHLKHLFILLKIRKNLS